MPIDTYIADVHGWAVTYDVVNALPTREERTSEFEFTVEKGAKFLVSVVTTPDGAVVSSPLAQFSLARLADGVIYGEPTDTPGLFVSKTHTLTVLNDPAPGRYGLSVTSPSDFPYAVRTMIFQPHIPATDTTPASPPPAPKLPGSYKCTACKVTSKILAAAIAATAIGAAWPTAVVAAVAAWVGQAFANAFILGVIGETVDAIGQKLCEHSGLC